MKKISELKRGEFFRLPNQSVVYVRDNYVRELKKYSCYKYEDVCNERFFKGDKLVEVDFEY